MTFKLHRFREELLKAAGQFAPEFGTVLMATFGPASAR
jgi:hypothetical protein